MDEHETFHGLDQDFPMLAIRRQCYKTLWFVNDGVRHVKAKIYKQG